MFSLDFSLAFLEFRIITYFTVLIFLRARKCRSCAVGNHPDNWPNVFKFFFYPKSFRMLLAQGRAQRTTSEEQHFYLFVMISLKPVFRARLLNCSEVFSSTSLRQRPHRCRFLCSPRTSPCLRFRKPTVNDTFY